LISEYPFPEGLSPIPQDVSLPPKVVLERDSVIANMDDRWNPQRMKGIDRNGLDCRAARFSHVDCVDPQRQENELRDKRFATGMPLFSRLCERSEAEIDDYRGVNYLDRHNILKDGVEKYHLEDSTAPADDPTDELLPIPDAWTATIEENNRITPHDHWQDVRRLTMIVHPRYISDQSTATSDVAVHPRQLDDEGFKGRQLPKITKPSRKKPTEESIISLFTTAGDTAVIYPKNFPEDVQALIDLMEWNGVADEPFKHYAERKDGFIVEHAPAGCFPVENSTLRQLLTNNYDITAIPKRSFFDTVRFYASDPMQKERLSEFSQTSFIDEYYDYTSRPRRSILEILQDFSSIKIPYQYMPLVFPIMRGREYSIASAGSLAECEGDVDSTRLELLVAVVKYKTVLRKTRRGLCTRYIESLRPGTNISISVRERGAPFANIETTRNPMLCIATGTGLAPIRAAFWERSVEEHGPNVLFFGARNQNADYFFKDEWPKLGVHVYTAFSRDQKEKIYVQDVIRQEYKLICELIQREATIMICGSSGNMPKAVRQAIMDAMIKGDLVKTDNDALAYLEMNNQLWEEVW
jgi:sulfite reductase alpha subunit-like flavoprotein